MVSMNLTVLALFLAEAGRNTTTMEVQLVIEDTRSTIEVFFGTLYESTYNCLW
jgi:hypothetical protein